MPHALLDLCRSAEYSVLFGRSRPDNADAADEPDYFRDLNLGQVVAQVAGEGDAFTLAPLFHVLPDDREVVALRQGVFDDLSRPEVRSLCDDFTDHMRRALASADGVEQMHAAVHAHRWQVRAAEQYCLAVTGIVAALDAAGPVATALTQLHGWLETYRSSGQFRDLEETSSAVQSGMRQVRYNVFIRAGQVRVGSYADERAYEQDVGGTFDRFRPGEKTDAIAKAVQPGDYDPIRDRIVELVARLQPRVFAEAESFCAAHGSFFDPTVVLLYRELKFYLGYLDLVRPLEDGGLVICARPDAESDDFAATETFDLALALQLRADHRLDDVVANDVALTGDERSLVVTGPNQGGKTTLARTVGQLHHLAALGCPVPGRDVRLAVPDRIFTHFDQAEVLSTQGSKLEEDLRSVDRILGAATSRSLVILNETFSSTTVADARELGQRVLRRLSEIGCRCVFVTFVDELSRLDEHTVSMASTVDEDDPSVRTFRVVRRRADGRAYAASLAAKYHLTYAELTGRIGS